MSIPVLRRLMPTETTAFRALRLRALREHPRVYTQTYEEEVARPEKFHTYMINAHIVMGVFIDEMLVGYTILSGNQGKMRHKGTVWGAYVLPEYRDLDLAKQMRLRLFEVAKRLGMKYCTSSIVADNAAAVQVHAAVGYVEAWREKDGVQHADGTFDDVLHLVKYL